MLVIRGRHKGERFTIGQAGSDWISTFRPANAETGAGTAAFIAHPANVEITGGELFELNTDSTNMLWDEFEAFEHGPDRWRFRPRVRVHRIADA